MKRPLVIVGVLLILVAVAVLILQRSRFPLSSPSQTLLPTKTFKILHIMSYHTPWDWTESLTSGFKAGLNGLKLDYQVLEMDTKRNSSEDWKLKKAQEAKNLIASFQPDLIYTTDDNAQKYIAKDYVNTSTPIVFAAVNADPANYNFTTSTNVAGVLEHEHFLETVKLLKEVAPSVKTIAIIYDDDPTWTSVVSRIKQKMGNLPEVSFVAFDKISTFAQYQTTIQKYQTTVDAVGLLGIHTFKDSSGKNVPWQDVLQWTTENSRLPDFSFWRDRIDYGTLVTVAVSGYEQGLAAGKLAFSILAEGKSPASLPISPSLKGKPAISLARADLLGLKIKSRLLTTTEVVNQFAWQK